MQNHLTEYKIILPIIHLNGMMIDLIIKMSHRRDAMHCVSATTNKRNALREQI